MSRQILYCWPSGVPVGLFLLTYFLFLAMRHIHLLLFKPGKFMGSQGVRHDLATEQQQHVFIGLPRWLRVKNLPACARDTGDKSYIPGSERSSRRGHGNPFQSLCLENPMNRGDWQATVHSSRIRHSLATEHTNLFWLPDVADLTLLLLEVLVFL